MNSRPPVSVCVPVYNGAAYLAEALDSVLGQSFADFEVLLIDDGSCDHSLEIANRYADRDERVRICHNSQNLGLTENWNRCVYEARGEWIKFVHQDDLLHRCCIEVLLQGAEHGPFVVCERNFLMDASARGWAVSYFRKFKYRLAEVLPGKTFVTPQEVSWLAVNYLAKNCFAEPSATLIHRSCFEKHGTFNPLLVQLCDLEQWLRIGIHTGVVYIDQRLVDYRVHATAATWSEDEARMFRRACLDPLILFVEMATAPEFAPLRSTVPKACPRIENVALRCLAEVLAKVSRARSGQRENRSICESWERTVQAYPVIESLTERLSRKPISRSVWKLRRGAKTLLTMGRDAWHRMRTATPKEVRRDLTGRAVK